MTGIAISKPDITRLTRRRSRGGSPRIPSAAETAKVSSPSGNTKRISLSRPLEATAGASRRRF